MRPIQLTVQGLHSFREKQSVDFESLCAGGVFGIFGPTGSGKSTLLDAMTLALYGKVDRAGGQTPKGILNHAEEQVAVSFTFELGYEANGKRYCVERTLKQKGEDRLQSATARLIDQTTDAVLADKATDVTQHVIALLGLSVEDFTRAVVLPQGKFSDFLSLKGKERRHMLQRLFHLEKYGDELTRKVKERLNEAKHTKELLEREQAGLGEATKEAVNEAKKTLKQIEEELTAKRTALQDIEETYKEKEQIKQLLTAKAEILTELERLKKEKERMEANEKKLQLAQEAKQLTPYIDELEESRKQMKQWLKDEQAAKQTLEQTRTDEKEARILFEKRDKQKQEEEPRLRSKFHELEQAKEEEKQLLTEEREVKELTEKQAQEERKIKEAQEKRDKAEKDLSAYEAKQKELKQELEQLEKLLSDKQPMYAALEEKRQLEAGMKQTEQLNDQVKEKENQRQNEQKASEQTAVEVNKKSEALQQSFANVYRWYDRTAEEKRNLESLETKLVNKIHLVLEEKEKQSIKQQAVVLSKELVSGEACPVCGSLEHPQLAHEEDHSAETLQDAKPYENELTRVRTLLETITKREWVLQQLSERFNEWLSTEDLLAHQQIEAMETHKLPGVDEERLSEKLQQLSTYITAESETVTTLEQQALTQAKELQQAEQLQQGHTLKVEQLTTDINNLEQQIATEANHVEQQKADWEKRHHPLAIATIEEDFKKLQEREQKAEYLRERINKSVPFIEEKQTEYKQHDRLYQEAYTNEKSIATSLDHIKKALEQRRKRIIQWVGERAADEVYLEAKKQFDQMIEQFEQAEKAHQKANQAYQEAKQQHAVAVSSLDQAKTRNEKAEQTWKEQLEDTLLVSVQQVKEYQLSTEEYQTLETEIKNFKDKFQSLQHKIEEVEKQLNGREVSEEEWQKTKQERKKIKHDIDFLSEKRGGAQTTLEDIETKHDRYLALEAERKEAEELESQLSRLDTVFRGQAFVEFIAEEQLIQITRLASEKLHQLTRGRYAIEVDSSGGFIIRDDANGGIKRPVSTLSGGETFLTSLALALALSASIQLNGEHPLEFFFLDEGFGTLDEELLETVISALEKLHTDSLSVGVISHVPELKERLPRRLTVEPAEPAGRGSRVKLEVM
ncbi:AAA family ATPase [Salsuginibacillus kocurii]|uniref:AAA family ATPase n=1 Tax=Salsuginibacillus kocurii TaxID=427078 RepID=UPI00037601F4|nr:AAA family ATPase [Salsuginibacillus kocurii]